MSLKRYFCKIDTYCTFRYMYVLFTVSHQIGRNLIAKENWFCRASIVLSAEFFQGFEFYFLYENNFNIYLKYVLINSRDAWAIPLMFALQYCAFLLIANIQDGSVITPKCKKPYRVKNKKCMPTSG